MYIIETIKEHIADLVNKQFDADVVQVDSLTFPPEGEMGDLSLPCFEISKKEKKAPGNIASELFKAIKPDEIISGIRAVGPYLNFIIKKEYLAKEVLAEIDLKKEKFGNSEDLKGRRIMIEYAHPNPFKSFHIGHLRNIILGESLVRLFESQGAEVIRTNYQGDVGMHIAKCLWSFKEVDPKDYPSSTDDRVALLGKCYAHGAKAYEEDQVAKKMIQYINKKIYEGDEEEIKKLWELGKKWSLDKFHEIYERVYSHFDREYMESEVMDDGVKYVNEALEKGILEKSDGAVIFNGKKYKLDTRVFLTSENLPTYEGKELGLAFREFTDFGDIDLCVHNVAVEQISFFKVTFKVQELLDPDLFKGKQYHNAYEFVGLKKGKMSSRKGEVILGNDILNEAQERIENKIVEKADISNPEETSEIIGVGAVKYSFLIVSPFKYLAFDMEESVNFEGHSGPYIQYSYVRAQSIIRKAKEIDSDPENVDLAKLLEDKEHNIILKMAIFPDIIKKAQMNYDPSVLAKYIYDLSKMFNDYYHQSPVIGAEAGVREARLFLVQKICQIIKNGLYLLGIKTVDKM